MRLVDNAGDEIASQWFVCKFKKRHCESLEKRLSRANITFFLPKNDKTDSAGKKDKLYFDEIIFVNCHREKISEIRQIRGIECFLYWLNSPATISGFEMQTIKRFFSDFRNIRVEKIPIEVSRQTSVTHHAYDYFNRQVISISAGSVELKVFSIGLSVVADLNTSTAFEIVDRNLQKFNSLLPRTYKQN